MTNTPGLYGAILVGLAIVCATVAAVAGDLSGEALVGILSAGLGIGGGAGAHAAGVKQGGQ